MPHARLRDLRFWKGNFIWLFSCNPGNLARLREPRHWKGNLILLFGFNADINLTSPSPFLDVASLSDLLKKCWNITFTFLSWLMQVQQNMVQLWSEEINPKKSTGDVRFQKKTTKFEEIKVEENRNLRWEKLIFQVREINFPCGRKLYSRCV